MCKPSPKCQKEVYTSVLEVSSATEPGPESENLDEGGHSDFRPRQEWPGPNLYYGPNGETQEEGSESEDDDIFAFKRVAQENIRLRDRKNQQVSELTRNIRSQKHQTPTQYIDSSRSLHQRQSRREHDTE